MLELMTIVIFAGILILCIIFDISVLAAMVIGFFLFSTYALYKKYTPVAVLKMAISGIKTVKNILITFILIGVITAVWREAGTIPYIVYHAIKICSPERMVLASFLLCSLISGLTGTAFGTAATMGVICAVIADGMGVSPVLMGGAVLAGSYFGDRCSPMSTSAHLVSALTQTDLFRNIRVMIKTSVVPFLLTCIIYLLLGKTARSLNSTVEVSEIFEQNFVLTPWLLIPAAVIIVFSLLKINVKATMAASIFTGILLSLYVQKTPVEKIVKTIIRGYEPSEEAVAALLSGGGILSMKTVFCIVCISASYAGIFKSTGLLNHIKSYLNTMADRITPYGSILITSIITAMIACNQTLTIMLTYQLCDETEKDNDKMASVLENTAVVIAPLVPWSIACAVPLASVDAPMVSIAAACYLYLLPLWNYFMVLRNKKCCK